MMEDYPAKTMPFLKRHKNSKDWRTVTTCHWIMRNGWTTSANLMVLFGVRRSITQALLAAGLLEEHATPANKNASVKGYPHKVLTLANPGRALLIAHGIEVDAGAEKPLALTEDLPLRHDTAVQFLTARALQMDLIDDFEVPRTFGEPSRAGIKQPDMVLLIGQYRHALEVEMTRKSNAATADFISKIGRSLERNGGPYASIQLVTDDPYLHELYYLVLFDYAKDIAKANSVIQRSVAQIREQATFKSEDLLCIDLGLMPFY